MLIASSFSPVPYDGSSPAPYLRSKLRKYSFNFAARDTSSSSSACPSRDILNDLVAVTDDLNESPLSNLPRVVAKSLLTVDTPPVEPVGLVTVGGLVDAVAAAEVGDMLFEAGLGGEVGAPALAFPCNTWSEAACTLPVVYDRGGKLCADIASPLSWASSSSSRPEETTPSSPTSRRCCSAVICSRMNRSRSACTRPYFLRYKSGFSRNRILRCCISAL
mmetsp:Transcript_10901/g.23265  ORF Transcript_10901/g.23265 Transcript_10901/m.23265 type:complete len:219 (+) Transcript_10901:1725-2381(+)